jgi:hypothetical protein
MDTEKDVIEKLADIVKSLPHADYATPRFEFYPEDTVSEYGIGAQWAASIRRSNISTDDYGWTLQQAAERLLDRVLYPKKYPEDED